MIASIHRLIEDRDAGNLRIGYTRRHESDPIGTIAARLGLADDDEIYIGISEAEAARILKHLLGADLAYGAALNFDRRALAEVVSGYEDATWFTNLVSHDGYKDFSAGSANAATGASYDAGIIIVAGNVAVGIWVEDED